MFEGFDEAFADAPVAPVSPGSVPPLRRRKSLKQRLVFYAANLVIMPIIALVYATIIADGIRHLMPVFRRKLYSLPIPGAGLAAPGASPWRAHAGQLLSPRTNRCRTACS